MTSDHKRFVGALTIATITISCGPPGIEMMSDAMSDVGAAMVDAGHELMDTSDVMRDTADDTRSMAAAQACEGMTNCTTTGVLRVMTAESDPTRWEHGSATIFGPSSPIPVAPLVAGPIYLTNVNVDVMNGTTNLRLVPSGATCPPDGSGEQVGQLGAGFVSMGAAGTFVNNTSMAGLLVPEGSALCPYPSTTMRVSWFGYRPYD